jgi:hypothetical protein
MTEYRGYFISDNNVYRHSYVYTVQQCIDYCINSPTCRTLDYVYGDYICTGAEVTALDKPSSWSTSTSVYTHFQKTCAT